MFLAKGIVGCISFVAGFFCLECLQGLSMLRLVSALHSFLRSNNTPWYGPATARLSFSQLVDVWIASTVRLLRITLLQAFMHSCVRFVWTYVFISPVDALRSGSLHLVVNFSRNYQPSYQACWQHFTFLPAVCNGCDFSTVFTLLKAQKLRFS